jgi:hypothetical protein
MIKVNTFTFYQYMIFGKGKLAHIYRNKPARGGVAGGQKHSGILRQNIPRNKSKNLA